MFGEKTEDFFFFFFFKILKCNVCRLQLSIDCILVSIKCLALSSLTADVQICIRK